VCGSPATILLRNESAGGMQRTTGGHRNRYVLYTETTPNNDSLDTPELCAAVHVQVREAEQVSEWRRTVQPWSNGAVNTRAAQITATAQILQ
jgi:hypothetical protein